MNTKEESTCGEYARLTCSKDVLLLLLNAQMLSTIKSIATAIVPKYIFCFLFIIITNQEEQLGLNKPLSSFYRTTVVNFIYDNSFFQVMDINLLKEIGLSNSEIQVYIKLLNLGNVKVGSLMKEISLHRSRVYEALNRLTDKGLVSYVIRNNIKFFEATDPDRLITYIEEEKEKLDEKEKEIKNLIPNLKKQIPLHPSAEAHVYYGKEGFKTIRKDVLKQKQTLYLLGAVGKEDKHLKYFFPNFERLRMKNKIKQKMLYDSEVKGKKITKLPLMETKFLPKEYSSPAVINIYADRVVNVLWQGENPICFMIINKAIADSYRKWFDLLWNYSE